MFKLIALQPLRYCLLIFFTLLFSCRGPADLFKPNSPHQTYRQKLIKAGLDKTELGAGWISNADKSLQQTIRINIPYKETGYFAAERIPVNAYNFSALRGQKLKITIDKKPIDRFKIYLDIWERLKNQKHKFLTSADTLGNPLELDIDRTGIYVIRVQPELLQSGQYTLEITSGPSLAYPVKSKGKATIQSHFGDGRDANTRKHEGIDIFASFRTPVIAAAEGTVQRVNENNLGGKVVWMRPTGKNYTLYYAHLDEQIATEGQHVLIGDTLGLMGNTGNAKTTPPHLHFGIYTPGGAIDPYPFINPVIRAVPEVTSPLSVLNSVVRTIRKTHIYPSSESELKTPLQSLESGTVMRVDAANSNWYMIKLPTGEQGFIQSKQVVGIVNPLRKLKITGSSKNIYDQPDSLAAVKSVLVAGKIVNVLGNFKDYYLISDELQERGWISQK